MSLDVGLALTTACWAVAALAALVIAVPQTVLLVRTAVHRDELWWFRLKTVLLYGGIGVALLRNVAIWADYVLFDQRYFGTIDDRWPADLALSAIVMVAVVLAAVLYLQTQTAIRQ